MNHVDDNPAPPAGAFLKRVERDGWVELVDSRSGETVARAPLDRALAKSSADRYARAVQARQERLARQRVEDARLFASIWHTPVTV